MKKIVFLFLSVFAVLAVNAQVTTSSIGGKVVDEKGAPVVGVAVIATHTPTGTTYGTASDIKGNFRILNIRPGGPYTVEFRMLGFTTVKNENINVPLGDNFVLNGSMSEESTAIGAIEVISKTNAIMNSDRTGSLTNVNSRELTTLPTVSRGITDFTRLTPQAGSENGFAGRDGRYNNLMIDGANYNNRFGLSTKLPGGDAQPISLDAIQELTVNISPYDIRESSFTGASINAVTKSGDNEFKGTAYTYFRPKSFTGDKVGDGVSGANGVQTVKDAHTRNLKTFGFSFGGPIIQNKLFFFVTAELEKQESPGISWTPTVKSSPVATGDSGSASEFRSRTTTYDLDRVAKYLKDTYNYDAGVYEGFKPFESNNHKITARLDWNISKNHKAMIRYNEVVSENDQQVNATSRPAALPSLSSARYSADAFAFSNANYGFEDVVRSLAGELNSTFSDRLSNKFLATYTHIQTTRTSKSAPFPFVDIWEGGKQYMSFGYELYTWNNDVNNKTFTITDNLTYALGDHTITGGASFEYQYFANAYQQFGLGYYRFNSVDSFLNNAKPDGFGIQYPFNGEKNPAVELSFGMASLYLQDEWWVNSKLKLTGGIRFEMPFCMTDLGQDAVLNRSTPVAITDLKFNDNKSYDLGKWPGTTVAVSPRIGFNWDVNGDRSIQLRGGTGIFTGFVPFVWYTNQPGSSGFVQSPSLGVTGANLPSDFRFKADYNDIINNPAYANMFPQQSGVIPVNSDLCKVADDFKMPQIWRTSLAGDIQLPGNMIFTLEAIYSKDINAVVQENVNLKPASSTNKFAGADNRPVWWDNAAWTSTASSSKLVHTDVASFAVLSNTNKGYQFLLTAQLTKKFTNGFAGMIAYTYNKSKDTGNNPGSRAISAWNSNTDVYSLNNPGLGYSLFSVPHRVNGYVSYSKSYLKHLTTTVSLYYSGSHALRLNYVYTNDMNGDGYSSDLIFIPREDQISAASFVANGTYTAEQQYKDFFEYVNKDPYLKSNKGKYAERGGGVGPWVNRFDFKFIQDIYANFGSGKRYTLQFTADFLNVGNFINPNWGLTYTMSQLTYNNVKVLKYMGADASKNPLFQVNGNSTQNFKDNLRFTPSVSTASTWGCMLGFRLKF